MEATECLAISFFDGLLKGVLMRLHGKLKLFRSLTVVAVIVALSLVATSIPSLPGFNAIEAQAATASVSKIMLAGNTRYHATPMYIIKSGKPGPVVMIVGGVHGNEVAGVKAAHKIKNLRVKKGTLLVIPEANKVAVKNGTRTSSGVGDLNRNFPKTSSAKPSSLTATAIWNAVKKYKVDYLIDLHEGYNYHKIKPSSYGQTLIYYPISGSKTVGQKIINALNSRIGSSSKYFTLVKYPYKGTLARSTAQYLKVNAFTLETCRKSTLSARVNNGVLATKTLLRHLGMY